MKEYEYLIDRILRKVPEYLRDDCYQAAYLGLLKAKARQLSNKGSGPIQFFKAYAYRCMQNEVTKEVAQLHGSGHGAFSLDKTTFLLYCEYKRRKSSCKDISDMNLSDKRIDSFNKLIICKRYQFSEDPFNRDEIGD